MRMTSSKLDKMINRVKTISIICLIISLLLTGVIWASSFVTISSNKLTLGKIDIEIGYFDGNTKKYYTTENRKMFYNKTSFPEISTKEEFFIENKGNMDAWYSIYFDNIEGSYGDNLTITIKDANGLVLLGSKEEPIKASDFTKDNYLNHRIGSISVGETKKLILVFEHSESDEDIEQTEENTKFTFDFCVEAIQKKNNP